MHDPLQTVKIPQDVKLFHFYVLVAFITCFIACRFTVE